MFIVPQKKSFIPLIVIFVLVSTAMIGCGDSKGVTTLSGWLSDFSQLVESYRASVGSDQSKQAEWDTKVEAMTSKWIDIRNEFGSDVTPQEMEKMVQQYKVLMGTLTEFKKSIGS